MKGRFGLFNGLVWILVNEMVLGVVVYTSFGWREVWIRMHCGTFLGWLERNLSYGREFDYLSRLKRVDLSGSVRVNQSWWSRVGLFKMG